MKYFSLLFLIFLSFGCDSKQESKSESLTSERLELSDFVIRAKSLYFYDNLLFVTDPEAGHLFKVFDVEKNTYLGNFGSLGEGPCDVSFPSQILGMNNKSLSVFVKGKLSIIDFDLNQLFSASGPGFCIIRDLKVNVDFQRLLQLDEKRFFGVGYFEKKYALFSSENVRDEKYFFPFHFEEELSKQHSLNNIAISAQGNLNLKPDGKMVAFTTHNFGALDIINVEDSFPILVHRETFTKPLFGSEDGNVIRASFSDENLVGFLHASVTDKHIYGLYSGKPQGDDASGSDVVFVFDWEGKKVKTIHLDKAVSFIVVDKEGSFLIGYSDDGKANFYKYNLQNSLF